MSLLLSSFHPLLDAPCPYLILFYFIVLCVGVLCACMAVHHMNAVCPGGQKMLDYLELELWMVMRHHMGAGHRTWVFCTSKYMHHNLTTAPPLLVPLLFTGNSHWDLPAPAGQEGVCWLQPMLSPQCPSLCHHVPPLTVNSPLPPPAQPIGLCHPTSYSSLLMISY